MQALFFKKMKALLNADYSFGKRQKRPKSLQKRREPLTICIAAIGGNGQVFGASDRMITSGDVEYVPNVTEEIRQLGVPLKVFAITNSIAVMTAVPGLCKIGRIGGMLAMSRNFTSIFTTKYVPGVLQALYCLH
jgi:hypothetical protein